MTSNIDRLTDEDAEILKLGHGTIRGHTCKVLVLERGPSGSSDQLLPSVDALRAHVNARLDHAPRFRKRVVNTPLGVANPVWLDDPDFDIANHIAPLPAQESLAPGELSRLVARLMPERLDRSRPLWHMSVVEQLDGEAMAVIWRVHHSLADGTTCIRLGQALLWGAHSPDGWAEQPPDSGGSTAWAPDPEPSRWKLLSSGLADRVHARRAHGVRLPSLRALSTTTVVAARELRRDASLTRLAAHVGASRSIALTSLPLATCHQCGKSISEDVTVNDVVLAVLAGAIRGWLGTEHSIRVKVPVSLHQRDDGVNVGNHDSFFFVDLPVGEPDPIRRVEAINRETRERKLDHDAETLYHLGVHPMFAHWAMSPRVFTFNVSNVPGPREEAFVLGARMRELYSLAEVAQHHALRIAVMSAAGTLFFGLCADQAAVPDLDALAAGIHDSGEELLAAVGPTSSQRGA
ncbi:MAG TPA: wax ester/triacylglycerol synthase domain-containing protein [Solirubrobacteraceae bacterium]|nr:wax ester/triacylglycerol synthase domain-containing protein [Solirubrobacteraceae bacterium]